MSDDELAAAADAPARLARALRGARTLVEARGDRPRDPRARARDARGGRRADARAVRRAPPGRPDALDESGARAIVRELKAVGGDLRALRLALTGADRGPELWTVVAALSSEEALDRVRRARPIG